MASAPLSHHTMLRFVDAVMLSYACSTAFAYSSDVNKNHSDICITVAIEDSLVVQMKYASVCADRCAATFPGRSWQMCCSHMSSPGDCRWMQI